MLLCRFGYIIPIIAITGQLARAPRQEISEEDFPIRGLLFINLLIITVLLIGSLSFLPVLALARGRTSDAGSFLNEQVHFN